jgi:hypothetical protein
MRKNGKSKTCHRKSEEKGEFGVLRNESLMFLRVYPNYALTPLTKYKVELNHTQYSNDRKEDMPLIQKFPKAK